MTRKSRDPIFALIDAHRRALKARERATHALNRLKAKLDARSEEQRKREDRRLTCAMPAVGIGGTKLEPAAFISDKRDIRRHVYDTVDRAAFRLGARGNRAVHELERDALAELERQYERLQRAHRARRKAVGLTSAQQAVEDADLQTATSLTALSKAKPATSAGRAALAKHYASLDPVQAPWWALHAAMEIIAAS